MDKLQYMAIRKKYDLSIQKHSLFIHLSKEACLLGAVYLLWNFSGPALKFSSIPIIAALIFRNFAFMHEAVHKAVSKSALVNDVFGIWAGAICLLPYEPWRRSHLEHHTWSGNLDKDPVTAFVTVYPKMKPGAKNFLNFFWRLWFPMLAIVQYTVFWVLASKIFLKNRDSTKVLLSLAAPIVFWGSCAALLPTDFVTSALIPALLLYMVAVEVVNLPHHLQLPQYRGETRFPTWEQYKIARSCIYPRWFARWVALNFNYHTEHHMFPEVPWYHLEKLHLEVQPVLGARYNTDPYFKWIKENKPRLIDDVIKSYDQPQSNSEAA